MAKQFKIETSLGPSIYTARQYIDAGVHINTYIRAVGIDKVAETFGVRTFLKDAEVSIEEFVEACDAGYTAWLEAKELTHRRVKVLHGSSVGCYVWKWIKK